MIPKLILILLLSLSTHQACENFCMKTYKQSCQICYNQCGSSNSFASCSHRPCLEKDSKNQCQDFGPSENKDESTCLPTCCQRNIEGFSEQKFNLCIEYDAQTQNKINVGLTIGLTLGFVLILGIFGLIYILSFLCFKDFNQSMKKTDSDEKLQSKKTNSFSSSRKIHWLKQDNKEARLSGPCIVCLKKEINLMTYCHHGYHPTCLFNLKPCLCKSCGQNCESFKIFCNECHKRYFKYEWNSGENMTDLSNIVCNECAAQG